ncbi:protein RSI-1-like [Cucurbita pepo subsp. pepo]|uniref:protein RSI-1-like n=1 Tax=Cucurbita pepo subsp. pepo TaxID=3664 RepID=UPI000C9D379B|nr:protein RSI-1-like [Cucurbita pepo subsp. pepo]
MAMATSSRSYIVFLFFLVSVLFFLLFSLQLGVAEPNLHPSDCKARCEYRCSATSHKKPCMFYCQKCCATCLCVPPGTSGNKEVCPCYNDWKTKEGRPKCP